MDPAARRPRPHRHHRHRHPTDTTAGTWHVPEGEGPVVHRTVDGNFQTSVHGRDAFDDPGRFVKV